MLNRVLFCISRRRAYEQPASVGYAAWYDFFGRCVAFERLDGSFLFAW